MMIIDTKKKHQQVMFNLLKKRLKWCMQGLNGYSGALFFEFTFDNRPLSRFEKGEWIFSC